MKQNLVIWSIAAVVLAAPPPTDQERNDTMDKLFAYLEEMIEVAGGQEAAMGYVRHGGTIVGGILIAHGLASAGTMAAAQEILGVAFSAASVLCSIAAKVNSARRVKVALAGARRPLAWPAGSPANPPCLKAPAGWYCTRPDGHGGPCAAARKIIPVLIACGLLGLAGCAHYKASVERPDGTTMNASCWSFAHDADIRGLDFQDNGSNVTAHLTGYNSYGGATNFSRACDTIQAGFRALEAAAGAMK